MKQVIVLLAVCAPFAFGQTHEAAFSLGRVYSSSRSAAGASLDLGAGTALQANYGYRLFRTPYATFAAEINVLASPLRDVASTARFATRDFATLYVTPGLRVKFAPGRRVSPWGVIGGGYALYEQSLQRIDGAANPAPRSIHRGAFTFGGGADFRLRRWLALRGEIRDFYTGSPAYNVATRGGQHNLVTSVGFVLRFGRGE